MARISVSPVYGPGEIRWRMEDSDGKREITLKERLRSNVERHGSTANKTM